MQRLSVLRVGVTAAASPERVQMIEDARRWNEWAARMNARAIAAGLVTAEEVAQGRIAAEAALTRLRTRIA